MTLFFTPYIAKTIYDSLYWLPDDIIHICYSLYRIPVMYEDTREANLDRHITI